MILWCNCFSRALQYQHIFKCNLNNLNNKISTFLQSRCFRNNKLVSFQIKKQVIKKIYKKNPELIMQLISVWSISVQLSISQWYAKFKNDKLIQRIKCKIIFLSKSNYCFRERIVQLWKYIYKIHHLLDIVELAYHCVILLHIQIQFVHFMSNSVWIIINQNGDQQIRIVVTFI